MPYGRLAIDRTAAQSLARSYERILISAWRPQHLKECHEKARLALDDFEDPDEVEAQFEKDKKPALEDSQGGLKFRSAREICDDAPATVPWILKNYIAAGVMTEMTGTAKSAGKTTLLTHAVREIIEGRPFAGLPTSRTNVVYLSEENDITLAKALRKSGLESREGVSFLQWKDATESTWNAIVKDATAEALRISSRLMIVDTLPQFAEISGEKGENNPGDAKDALRPLQKCAAQGIGIVVVRQQRKAGGQVGQSARGTTQYTHTSDIILQIEAGSTSETRVIEALSRFDETPASFTLELTPNGYIAAEFSETARDQFRDAMRNALPWSEADAATVDRLLKDTGEKKRTLAYEILSELTKEGIAERIGSGKKGNPFKFFRAEDSSRNIHPSLRECSRTDESENFIRRDSFTDRSDEYPKEQPSFTDRSVNSSNGNSSTDELDSWPLQREGDYTLSGEEWTEQW